MQNNTNNILVISIQVATLFIVGCGLVVALQIANNSVRGDVPRKLDGTTRVASYNVHYLLPGKTSGP